jgi:hypothetical protein
VLRIGSLVLAYDKLSVIAATIILCALLYLFFNKTDARHRDAHHFREHARCLLHGHSSQSVVSIV